MKKIGIPILATLLLSGFAWVLLAQNIQHETGAINIEIPVRVYKGNVFVDTLTLDDFEIYEDGKLQKIDAVYLINKIDIERKEETKAFAPQTERHFYLFFEFGEFDPKIQQALDYFVNNVLIPGDNLVLITPMKTYRMKSEVFNLVSRERVYDQIMGIIRRDIQIGYSEYRNTLDELKNMARLIASQVAGTSQEGLADIGGEMFSESPSIYEGVSIEEQLQIYLTLLNKIQSLRIVDQRKLYDFSQYLKDQEGQKNVFLFYQSEFLPKLEPRVLNAFLTVYNERSDIVQEVLAAFEYYHRELPMDVDYIKKAFSDSSTTVHFLFVSRPRERGSGIIMEEQSEDIFAPFREMARATGGFSDSSNNIAAIMKSAVEAAENYYLLYYTPIGYEADGEFHQIQVRVKSGNYRISHRLGYIAD